MIPIKNIIPREVPENIRPIVNFFASTLEDMVNFGSNMMIWDDMPATKGEENVPPTMLFRHYLDILDSISILTKEGCGDTVKLLARGALETHLNIEYLFEKDSNNRAMAFLVTDILSQIKSVKKIHPGEQTGKNFKKTYEKEGVLSKLNIADTSELDSFIKSKENVLNLPQFQTAYEEYNRLKQLGEKNPKWYRYFGGPSSLEELAKHLNQHTFYELIYRKWSGATHGSDIYLGKLSKTSDDAIDIVQLRFIKDLQEVVGFSAVMTIKVFRLFIKNRIPNKEKDFFTWYKEISPAIAQITGSNLISVV